MKTQKSILVGFVVIIVLMIFASALSLYHITKISTTAELLYKHPFAVSNAVRSIDGNIIAMHRYMKDVVLSRNNVELITAIRLVDEHERKVEDSYKIVYERYLGDRKDIENSHKAFLGWKTIRQEVIDLMEVGEKEAAAEITKGKGAEYIKDLYTKVEKLLQYAKNKADKFHSVSVENKNRALTVVTISIAFILLISISIAIYILRNLSNVNRKTSSYLHMIDQNIMVAHFDKDKTMIDLTNELARSLNITKKSLLGTKNNFFFENLENDTYKEMIKHLDSGTDWSGEIRKNIDRIQRWFHLKIYPEFNDNFQIKGYTAILTEITDKKRIEEVSITDNLTQLYNRNYFELIVPKEINRAVRENKALSMIMLDIDFFKQYNDTYGHLQGDFTLKAVSSVIKNMTQRSYDYSFRLGGEEFAVLFYSDSYEKALEFTEKMRENVEKLEIEHEESSVSKYVTISIGMIHFQTPSRFTKDEMYKEVDALLYQAKERGRNRIVSTEMSF